MITRLLIPAIFLLPASGHAQEHFQPGVYDLRICGPSCASGSTIAQGTLILLAAPVRDASGAPLIVGIPQPVNGCFRFARYQPHGMIGHKEGGYLIWSQAQGRLFLNFSPDGVDAGYSIEFPVVPGELKGKGVTWYASENWGSVCTYEVDSDHCFWSTSAARSTHDQSDANKGGGGS